MIIVIPQLLPDPPPPHQPFLMFFLSPRKKGKQKATKTQSDCFVQLLLSMGLPYSMVDTANVTPLKKTEVSQWWCIPLVCPRGGRGQAGL